MQFWPGFRSDRHGSCETDDDCGREASSLTGVFDLIAVESRLTSPSHMHWRRLFPPRTCRIHPHFNTPLPPSRLGPADSFSDFVS